MSDDRQASVAPVPPIELKVPLDADGQVDPIAAVSWCIDEGFVEQVENNPEITDPHLLLLVCTKDRVVERHLVPLDQQPLRLVFNGSGENVLRATTVWPNEGENRSHLRKAFFDKDSEYYVSDLTEWSLVKADWDARTWRVSALLKQQVRVVGLPEAGPSGQYLWQVEGSEDKIPEDELTAGEMKNVCTMRTWFRGCKRHGIEDKVVVHVEEGLFAPEPPRFFKWLVELYPWWKNSDSRDQCHFREKALMATPLSLVLAGPAVVVCAVIAVIIAGYEVCLLTIIGLLHVAGMRGINYTALRHPLNTPPNRIWKHLGNEGHSRWFTDKDDKPTPKALRVFNPVTYLLAGLVVWGLALLSLYSLGGISLVIVPLGACFVLGLVAPSIIRPLGRFFIAWDERREAEAEEKKRRELEAYRAQLSSFICGAEPRLLAPRTVRMRLSDLGYKIKDQVCRPYAQYHG